MDDSQNQKLRSLTLSQQHIGKQLEHSINMKSANSTSQKFIQQRKSANGIRKKIDPGLYFDEDKGYPAKEQEIAEFHQFSNKGPLPHSEKSQKLYSPYEYLHYATKLNFSKESYMNALQQLGFQSGNQLGEKPLNDIMNQTNGIIKNSYSIKYIGVIEGNMGILSKRLKLQSNTNGFSNNSQQQISHQKGFTQQQQNQKNNQRSKSLYNNNKPAKFFQEEELQSQNQFPSQIQYPPQQLDHFNNQQQMNSQNSQLKIKPNDQLFPKPELYNTYIVGKYALPNYLKTLKKSRDPKEEEFKHKLELWHADKIKGITHSNFAENQVVAQNQHIASHQLLKRNQKKNFIYNSKKPVKNYEENPEEGICYAIIERPKDKEIISFSRLLNQIPDQVNPNLIIKGNQSNQHQLQQQSEIQQRSVTGQKSQAEEQSSRFNVGEQSSRFNAGGNGSKQSLLQKLEYKQNHSLYDRFNKLQQNQLSHYTKGLNF